MFFPERLWYVCHASSELDVQCSVHVANSKCSVALDLQKGETFLMRYEVGGNVGTFF